MNDKPKRVVAAGGVLWRHGDDDTIEVAGIYRPACDNWSLPKGKLSANEHPLSGSCREVEEETGLDPIPQTFLTTATYELDHPDGAVTKVVDYWSMRARDPRARFVASAEVTELRWFGLDEAFETLTRPRDQQALSVFRNLAEVTATVVLLRHANAEPGADDRNRQLDATGKARAAELVPLLALYDLRTVVAATIPRCVATVTPLAAALGEKVDTDAAFDLDVHIDDPEAAMTRLRDFADDGGAIVCSQLPVIADTLALLTDTDDLSVADVHTEPGDAWVLSFNGRRLVAVERLR
ncbi:NUDIX hydrolase [Stackebrandtia soli]|uniref:NUDIX hydrolase n=1 Tax=Stackebrandtia soli TaxID=1892856 RepID=UPI0039ED617C